MGVDREKITVSVKFFLNKRLKENIFNGKAYFPLYARLNVLGNNIQFKVIDRSGMPIFWDDEIFATYDLWINEEVDTTLQLFYDHTYYQVMDKRLLFIQSFLKYYEIKRGKFDYKEFVKFMKFYEQSLLHLLEEEFIKLLQEQSKKKLSFQDFNSIDFSKILVQNGLFNTWLKLMNGHLSEEVLLVGETLGLIKNYINNTLGIARKNTVTTKGLLFDWKFKDGKEDLSRHIDKHPESILNTYYPYSNDLAESFLLAKEKKGEYIKTLDLIVENRKNIDKVDF